MPDVAGYELRCPREWTHVRTREVEDGGVLLEAVIAHDIELKVVIWPGGGAHTIDGYFKAALVRFDDTTPRGFVLEHHGLRFRGWLIEHSPSLSSDPEAFANFYGTECRGDAVCWAWYSLGRAPADADAIEEQCLGVICTAIANRLPS